jgi:hypothetical protein
MQSCDGNNRKTVKLFCIVGFLNNAQLNILLTLKYGYHLLLFRILLGVSPDGGLIISLA